MLDKCGNVRFQQINNRLFFIDNQSVLCLKNYSNFELWVSRLMVIDWSCSGPFVVFANLSLNRFWTGSVRFQEIYTRRCNVFRRFDWLLVRLKMYKICQEISGYCTWLSIAHALASHPDGSGFTKLSPCFAALEWNLWILLMRFTIITEQI